MIDFEAAQMRSHRRNIECYCRLVATELTDLERQYLHQRIAEEHAQLKQLEKRQGKRGGHAAPSLSASLLPGTSAAAQQAAASTTVDGAVDRNELFAEHGGAA
jgi:hypothetical protein